MDEVYQAFQDLGMLSTDNRKKGSGATAGCVNERAGAFNRYLQFGDSARATKSVGTLGEVGEVTPTSFGEIGNIHTDAAIPMDRNEIGNHTGATKERIHLWTAPRF